MKTLKTIGYFAIASSLAMTSCKTEKKDTTMKAGIVKSSWGESDNKKVDLYTLTNKNGLQVTISTYGGTVTSWIVPDKNGKKSSILLGYDSLSGYLAHPPYFGALIGRYGNRIANGKFKLDGKEYKLATNDGKNHLHGGLKGFDKIVWTATTFSDTLPSLALSYISRDGEEGYPGNLKVTVLYSLTDDNELSIEYNAETDKATPVNLTNHSYFNLTGDHVNTILDETLKIDADFYTPVDSTLIPTGEIKSVKGTPFDFTTATKIGARIDSVKGGYDHNWVLNRKGKDLQLAAVLVDDATGRKLEVFTTEIGLQVYSGNFLDAKIQASHGVPFLKHTALCMETQHFPDSPNEPKFPTTILKPGEKYHSVTKYKISVL